MTATEDGDRKGNEFASRPFASRLFARLWGLYSAGMLLVCAATLAGFVGRLWWCFELASHFRVQYAVLLLLGAAVMAARRNFKWLALPLAFAIVNLAVIVPLYVAPADAPTASKPPLRLLSFNVYTGNRRIAAIVDEIRETDPDLVVLLEVGDEWKRALADLQTEYPFVKSRLRADNFGIAFLSRLPAEEISIRDIGDTSVPSVVAKLLHDDQPFTLIATHALPPANRIYFEERNRQLAAVADLASAEDGPVIVAGDLNVTSWSPYFRDMVEISGLRDSRCGFGIAPTWPLEIPPLLIPIDHVLVSPNIAVHDRYVGPNLGSDHYSVVLDFSVEP